MRRLRVLFCSVGGFGGFLGCFWNCFGFFRLFMNMSYLSVDVAACLEEADWCISVVSWFSLIFTLYGASHQGFLVWVLPNLGNTDCFFFH